MEIQRSRGPFLLALAIMAAVAALGPAARNTARRAKEYEGAVRTPEEMEKRNSNAFAVILGEVRASAADLMFIKTERYLHSGVAYQPHLDVDQMAETGQIEDRGAEAHDVQTVIRGAAGDFRGFLGDLERAVKPYRDPSVSHEHTTGEELLPWYRLMTLADPRYVRAYMIGAMWLTQQGKWAQAHDFLKEGIAANQNNPELFRLYVSLALLYIKSRFAPNWGDARWLDNALEASRKAFDLAVVQRPEGGKLGAIGRDLVWREDLEDEFRFAGRWVAILLRDKGDRAEAMAAARQFQAYAPDDGPIRALLQELESQGDKNAGELTGP